MTCKCADIDYPAVGLWRYCRWCLESMSVGQGNSQAVSNDLRDVAVAMKELAYELRTSSRRPVFVANRPSLKEQPTPATPGSNRYIQTKDA